MRKPTAIVLTFAAMLGCSGVGSAATVALEPGATLPASRVSTSAGMTGSGDTYLPTVPGAYVYSQGFGPNDGATPAAGPDTEGFYVDYVFAIDTAVANSLTTTIALGNLLGVTGLSARLFAFDPLASIPITGAPPGAIVSWTTPLDGGSGYQSVIQDVALASGTYVLQVRGTVTGTSGGGYSGMLNLAPVPLPAAAWLLLSGLAGLGAAAWRRRGVAAA